MTSVFEVMAEQIERTPLPEPGRTPAGWTWRPGPGSGRPRRSGGSWVIRRPALVGAVTALAAITAVLVAVLVIALGSSATSPAYAIARHGDGAVTISLWRVSGVAALNRKLSADGIAVRAVPAVRGCDAPAHLIGPNHEPEQRAATVRIGLDPNNGRIVSMMLQPPIDPDRTIILVVGPHGGVQGGQEVEDPIPACVGYASSGAFMIPAG
jgi:hypothetical protein